MTQSERIEAARAACLETHRLDGVAARTGHVADEAAAHSHFLNVEGPAMVAAFGGPDVPDAESMDAFIEGGRILAGGETARADETEAVIAEASYYNGYADGYRAGRDGAAPHPMSGVDACEPPDAETLSPDEARRDAQEADAW